MAHQHPVGGRPARRASRWAKGLAKYSAVGVAGLMVACAGVPSAPPLPAALWADLLPAPQAAAPLPDPAQALALSPAMQAFLHQSIMPLARDVGRRDAMLKALFEPGLLRLDYDSSRTRSAAEAFEARAGNCLSLVLMTAAFAQALDLKVSFQRVDSESSWSLSGDYEAYSGHVNLVLGGGATRTAGNRWDTRVVIDFLPPEDLVGLRSMLIDQPTVLAMFANNRAAEALSAGRVDEAAAWSQASLRQAPQLVPAWNTAGLVHRQRGDAGRAERAWAHALAADPDNTRVLANLAGLLEAQGRGREAATLHARLTRLEPVAPFTWFRRGQAAMAQGRWAAARDAFARELARDPHYHAFHAWMAQAQAQLGNMAAVRRHLALARETSATPQQQALYGAKLDRLQAPRHLQ